MRKFRIPAADGKFVEVNPTGQARGLPALDPVTDRAIIGGSPSMLSQTAALLDARLFPISPHIVAFVTTASSLHSS